MIPMPKSKHAFMIQWSMKTSSDIKVGDTVGLLKITGLGLKKFEAVCNSCGKEQQVYRTHINKILSTGKMHGCSCSRRRETTTSEYKWRFGSYKQAAEKRGLGWNLSYDEFIELTQRQCYYCGMEPELRPSHHKRWDFKFPMSGIDRVDSSKGYYPDNTVACCTHCNRAKWDYSLDEFYSWLDRVVEHRNKGVI